MKCENACIDLGVAPKDRERARYPAQYQHVLRSSSSRRPSSISAPFSRTGALPRGANAAALSNVSPNGCELAWLANPLLAQPQATTTLLAQIVENPVLRNCRACKCQYRPF